MGVCDWIRGVRLATGRLGEHSSPISIVELCSKKAKICQAKSRKRSLVRNSEKWGREKHIEGDKGMRLFPDYHTHRRSHPLLPIC